MTVRASYSPEDSIAAMFNARNDRTVPCHIPSGSKDPNNGVLGPKYH